MSLRDLDVIIDIRADDGPLQQLNNQLNNLTGGLHQLGNNGLNSANNGLNNLNNNAHTSQNGLNGLNDSANNLNGNLNNVGGSSQGAGIHLLLLGEGAMEVGQMFSDMGQKILGAFGDAAKVGMDFQAQMDKVGAIAQASSGEMEALNQSAVSLGASTTKSASEVAVAMQGLAAKGFDSNKIIAAMPGIISAAEASGEDLALTADVVTSAMNGFGMAGKDASKVADILSKASNETAAGVGDMGYAFKYAAPIFNQTGMNLESLAAATGIMVDKGMEGSQAGTALRMGLLRLAAAPTPAKKAMDKLGFSAVDAHGKFKPLDKMVNELSKSMAGMSDADKLKAVKDIFGVEAASGWLNLINEVPGRLKNLETSFKESGGASAATAKQMMDNAKGGLETLSGSVESFKIKMESVFDDRMQGAFRKLGEGVDKITQSFSKLDPSVQTAIITFGVTFGALLVLGGGALFAAGMFGMLAAGMGITIGALLGIVGVSLAVVAAVAGIVAVAVLLWQNWDTVKAKARTWWDSLGAVKGVVAAITLPISWLIRSAVSIGENWDSTKSIWDNVWAGMVIGARNSVNDIIGSINSLIGVINKIPGINIGKVGKVHWGASTLAKTNVGSASNQRASGALGPDGFHATGLGRVPFDNYMAGLHKDESVLTANQSNALRSAGVLSGDNRPSLNMDNMGYTPQSTASRGNTNKTVIFSPKINVDGAGANATNIKQLVKEAIEESYDLFSTLYPVEVEY